MRIRVGGISIALAIVLIIPAGLSAQDPMDGTWELDVAASKFEPGPARRSDVRTYKLDGNTIHMTSKVVHADGRVEDIQFDAALDGKDYSPTGNPRVETLAQVRVDAHTIKTTTKRAGKVTATSVRQVSKDGKMMTITTTGTDEKGVAFNNTLVFRKRHGSGQNAPSGAAWACRKFEIRDGGHCSGDGVRRTVTYGRHTGRRAS